MIKAKIMYLWNFTV